MVSNDTSGVMGWWIKWWQAERDYVPLFVVFAVFTEAGGHRRRFLTLCILASYPDGLMGEDLSGVLLIGGVCGLWVDCHPLLVVSLGFDCRLVYSTGGLFFWGGVRRQAPERAKSRVGKNGRKQTVINSIRNEC